MQSIRTTTAVLAASGALLAAGAPAAMAQSGTTDYPSDSTTNSQTAKPAKGKRGKARRAPRRLSDAQLTRVAAALGTDLAALKAAQAKVKAAVDATDARETRAEHDALLAGELGVTVEQLRTAFASVRGTTEGKCKTRAAAPTADYPADN